MANKILTFVDATVLIYAANKPTALTLARRMRALQVLGDPDREFLASEYLRLEVLPLAVCYHKSREVAFDQRFFEGAVLWVESSKLISPAYDLASRFGLGALDALHVAAAATHNAELVCAERPTKPIYRAYPNATSIYCVVTHTRFPEIKSCLVRDNFLSLYSTRHNMDNPPYQGVQKGGTGTQNRDN